MKNVFALTDGYKLYHHMMYPEGTSMVYDNLTPRSSRHYFKKNPTIVSILSEYFVKKLDTLFEDNFFFNKKPQSIRHMLRSKALGIIKEDFDLYTGTDFDITHIKKLQDLGYLPLIIKALPEGTFTNTKVPILTTRNTHPDFYWLPNYVEPLLSNNMWLGITSATTAYYFKKLLTDYAVKTDSENVDFVDYQAHDFSSRGMSGDDAACTSGFGHAMFFKGSDNLFTLNFAREYYNNSKGFINGVPATEHSVMSCYGKANELETFKTLLDKFPEGVLSVVSDTWNLWNVLENYLPILKNKIINGKVKLVIRPDSGDPEDILCGSKNPTCYAEDCGVVEYLINMFPSSTTKEGYSKLHPNIGVIYGDSINYDMCERILQRLKNKGIASTNVVFGIGSYTYQYNTRDTLGFAVKATYAEVNKEPRKLFKNPITDSGVKKSAKGLLSVGRTQDNKLICIEDVDFTKEREMSLLETKYLDGVFVNCDSTVNSVREHINRQSFAFA